ncbi:hypothetical protein AB0K00_24115 [Dactylosporangium sp. NPDC049525]|uniref:hypothetical protein n=1 Tax=Dactylosporangium sp. NPDC049525 TaxID=3154730 RepID=UPI0034172D2B
MSDETRTIDVPARRYRKLLRAYPKAWRADRGDEMLGTLLDAAEPGRRWPSARESASIVVQGLRERLDLRRRRSTGAVWSEGLRIGALVLLGQAFAVILVLLYEDLGQFVANPYTIARYAGGITLTVGAMAALVAGRTTVATVLTGLWALLPAQFGELPWQLVTAFAVLAGLSLTGRAQRRQRTSAVWLAVVPAVVALYFGYQAMTGSSASPADALLYPFVVLLAVTVGVLVDPRLPIAAACVTVVFMLTATLHVPTVVQGRIISGVQPVELKPQTTVFAAIAVVLLTIGHLRARRLARI